MSQPARPTPPPASHRDASGRAVDPGPADERPASAAAAGNPVAPTAGTPVGDAPAADEPAVGTPAASWSAAWVAQRQQQLGEAICQRLGIYALPPTFVLSVIVPVYNEVRTVDAIISRLRATGIPMQIILVDDGSGDGSAGRIAAYAGQSEIVRLSHPHNRGKGAAIRTALEVASGDIIVIQDADQEYDPEDFRYLMQPILQGRADIVYGTRYGHADRQVSPLWHEMANGLITRLANLALGIRLSDVETCYKMARREAWQAIAGELRENRFGIEIELTARWARRGLRFFERPIRYQHRWYAEGKKIGWRDGVAALGCIVRYGCLRR